MCSMSVKIEGLLWRGKKNVSSVNSKNPVTELGVGEQPQTISGPDWKSPVCSLVPLACEHPYLPR